MILYSLTAAGCKFLRKTAVNLIHQHFNQPGLTDMFLGHTARASRRCYVEDSVEQLFQAIDWLDEQFGLGEVE